MNPHAAPRLEARRLCKRFPGVLALEDVSLRADRGEVLAIVGENGAGKSTLMKILAGVLRPDRGLVLLDGVPVRFLGVRDALAAGITLIHQELNLAENLSIGANLFLGREPTRRGMIDESTIERESRALLDEVGLEHDPRARVSELSLAERQLVEIARSLSAGADVIIMDEPTSSLSATETARLFEVIRRQRRFDKTVLYISHRLGEISDIADRVLVLRDGRVTGELSRAEVERERLISLMVGRDLAHYRRSPGPTGDVLLRAVDLRTKAHPGAAVSLEVRAGEIVALAGLVGSGRTELLMALFGAVPALSGSVEIRGRTLTPRSPGEAAAAGIALVPEDRKRHGLVLEKTVRENVSLAVLRRDARLGFIERTRERERAEQAVHALRIRAAGIEQRVGSLSGGNQQKVILGRWLQTSPRVFLLDEPTRGVDIGAKHEIYQWIERLAAEGRGVLLASSEMEEVLALADRVLVMHEGRIAGELGRAELSEESIMHLATGGPT